MIKEQSKWIEALIDYSLNIHENSPTLKPSYNQTIFTNDLILFLQKIFKNTKIFELFLAEINSFSLQFNITSYLKDFIRNCQFDLIEKKSYATLNVLTFAYYINGIIKSAKEFSTELNKEINNLIKYLYDLFRTCLASSSKNTIDYFFALTICLCCLYDENSVFYDEQNLLQSLLVLQMNSNDNIETEMVCRVCLTCAAYKSNLIDNEVLVNLYKKLTEVCYKLSIA